MTPSAVSRILWATMVCLSSTALADEPIDAQLKAASEAFEMQDYDRAIDMGVDAITTDFPGRLRARLSARAEKRPSATKGAGL